MPPVMSGTTVTAAIALLGLDVVVLDDLAPLRGFLADVLGELFGRAGLRIGPEAAQALRQVAACQGLGHFGAQLVDDVLRRSARRAEPVPGVDVESLEA